MSPEQFETLYNQLEKKLFNCAYRWVWNRDEAIDLVQEAFMKLWQKRKRIAPDAAQAYAFKTVINLASNRLRWKKVWDWVGLDGVQLLSKQDDYARKQQEYLLKKHILELPEKMRQVLILHRFGELGYREISNLLGIPEGTVASRNHEALKLLKRDMEKANVEMG